MAKPGKVLWSEKVRWTPCDDYRILGELIRELNDGGFTRVLLFLIQQLTETVDEDQVPSLAQPLVQIGAELPH